MAGQVRNSYNRYVREWLLGHPLTKDAVVGSEERRNLTETNFSKEDVDFLEKLVPYVAGLPDKVRAVLSQTDPPANQVRRAFTDCKHRNLLIRPYANHVHGLHLLIDEIYDRSRGLFDTKEEVFKLFVKAVIMRGDVLPVGRVVEKTFGAGSFRRLGKGEEVVPGGSDREKRNLPT